ncbi:MAG: YggU family protein [Deltaproteobacteria bacterium RIFCSPLOWO2_12_FULL_43_16]|nr:MAG: YggU family protein [Deltaproteobacteria bacterium GWA2_43_19]OGQ09767.1 MAG: YggU family protein [Deltaproteobacteria bacterium RIFCSPHIGHO2_02_FULL_43_33]OGQ58922.1 MAG: YggU family protein [Deltaproteobacteria bacterium RIFCSPLOWO2_12_FULL_43_16]HBR17689.1 YggU family protein [Deltaproteobacteria bacterium]
MTNSNSSKSKLPFLTEGKDGIVLKLYIQPRASKNEIAGIHDNSALKIRLTSPPVDGAANSACIKFLAAILGIRKNQIEITVGQKSRVKLVQITGRLLEEVENSLLEYL